MALDYLAILTLIIGNGALITISTLIFNNYTKKWEKVPSDVEKIERKSEH